MPTLSWRQQARPEGEDSRRQQPSSLDDQPALVVRPAGASWQRRQQEGRLGVKAARAGARVNADCRVVLAVKLAVPTLWQPAVGWMNVYYLVLSYP